MGDRLAIAGMGLATALAADPAGNWERASLGASGTCMLEGFSHRGKPLPVGRCPDAELSRALERAGRPPLDALAPRVLSLAECVAAQALLDAPVEDPDRTGLYLGSSLTTAEYVDGLYARLHEQKRRTPPSALIEGMSGSIAFELAARFGLRGPACTVSTSCTSSLVALQYAARELRAGAIDAALVVGVDSSFAPSLLGPWMNARLLSFLEPAETAGRPFCATRQGMVYAEGAAAVVLRRARRPGGFRYLGGAVRQDPDGRIATSEAAMLACLRAALADAGIAPERLDLVEANASGGHLDLDEAKALAQLVGKRAPVRAVKASVGNPLGASGLVSLVHGLLAMQHHRLPATANLQARDPAIEPLIDCYHSGHDLPSGPVALIDNFGFGGTNAAAVVALEEEERR